MKFVEGEHYFDNDGYHSDFTVEKRNERTKIIRGFVGVGLPANYKLRVNRRGVEYVTAKGRIYEASR